MQPLMLAMSDYAINRMADLICLTTINAVTAWVWQAIVKGN